MILTSNFSTHAFFSVLYSVIKSLLHIEGSHEYIEGIEDLEFLSVAMEHFSLGREGGGGGWLWANCMSLGVDSC